MSYLERSSRMRKRNTVRRGTERGDVVFLYHFEYVCRDKFIEVVDKDIGSGNPLSVEFSPHGFSPAGVGQGKVQALFVEIVPVRPGNDVSQRIGEVVSHHLGVSGGTRGEVEQGGVGRWCWPGRDVQTALLPRCRRGSRASLRERWGLSTPGISARVSRPPSGRRVR